MLPASPSNLEARLDALQAQYDRALDRMHDLVSVPLPEINQAAIDRQNRLIHHLAETLRICSQCGRPGAIWDRYYLGGHGYVTRLLCRDLLACERRRDAIVRAQELQEVEA